MVKPTRIQDIIKRSNAVSEEYIKTLGNLTKTAELHSSWQGNEMGEDYTLYTLDGEGDHTRYFICRYIRDWNGGWSYDDCNLWYEISKLHYGILYNMIQD